VKIISAEFVKSCQTPDQFPKDGLPEIAVVGRSNVGKSSLINSLLQRKGLAKVSGTPGKTRLVNFFRVTTADPRLREFFVVDLPGYGYAKVARSVRAQWGPMVERYLSSRNTLGGVIQIVDARGTEGQDRAAYAWLRELGREPFLVATKVDKLGQGARRASEAGIRTALDLPDSGRVLAYSSVVNEGRDALWGAIKGMIGARLACLALLAFFRT
jgi:GTP-binding protein